MLPTRQLYIKGTKNYCKMKKSILILLFLAMQTVLLAEEKGKSILVDGRVWNYIMVYSNGETNDTTYHSYTAKGPVEFDGKSCYSVDGSIFFEEGNCVYSYSEDHISGEKVWQKELDFNMTLGMDNVVSIDSIMVGTQLHRRIKLDSDIWVEGIGGRKYGIFASWHDPVPGSLRTIRIISVYDGNECIFKEEDFQKSAYTTDVKKVMSNVLRDEPFYDLQGRKLQRAPQRGAYILGGKKYIKK